MGVIHGLTISSISDLSKWVQNYQATKSLPSWLDFSTTLGKLTGNYKLADLTVGLSSAYKMLFKTPQWPIGGIYFDGIMRTQHQSRIRPTQYPVQTGVVMTDHAIIMPAEVSIEIMMTDTTNSSYFSGDTNTELIYEALRLVNMYSNIIYQKPNNVIAPGDGRSALVWTTLKSMQQSRVPITVETRLQTYKNMVIEELSAPDDNKTYHALKCNVRLREIIMADVAETQTSARSAATTLASTGGTAQATAADSNADATAAINSAHNKA